MTDYDIVEAPEQHCDLSIRMLGRTGQITTESPYYNLALWLAPELTTEE